MEMLFSNRKRFWHIMKSGMQGGFLKNVRMIFFLLSL